MIRVFILAIAIYAQPLVDEDVLEPSVRNEVDRALTLTPSNDFARASASIKEGKVDFGLFGLTNGVSKTDAAISIVSSQRSDGRWYSGTNDVTSAAAAILMWSCH
ncbi:MAG: hypothetical protein J6R63_01745 [Kiritimatiellae bacterium]|jgi:hypothetical protein|nr:hypothetical protein [Kiritimatiellia bacterium]